MKNIQNIDDNKWNDISIEAFVSLIKKTGERPLVLIDGLAGSGKSTLTAMLASHLEASIVASDDLTWHADPITWSEMCVREVIKPWQASKSVRFKPNAWHTHHRPGCIFADGKKPLLIEGMSVCRKTLMQFADYTIWVYADEVVARNRVISRDLANQSNGTTRKEVEEFAAWWDAQTHPFLMIEQAWNHVDAIIKIKQIQPTVKLQIQQNPKHVASL